jgi:hypothetical protein
MEIAKFVLTAIGTFISVSGLTFAVFQFWAKRRDEKDSAFRSSVMKQLDSERALSRQEITDEKANRKEDVCRIEERIDKLEQAIMGDLQRRLSSIEGELKAMRGTLRIIEDWFVKNTPGGK